MTSFDTAFKKIGLLVEDFKQHEEYYLNKDYNETEARIRFVNQFFDALGWDVTITGKQRNPYEQEVQVEQTQSNQKRPDYSFFLTPDFKTPKFFVEAKKPTKSGLKDADYYFQTIMYGACTGCPITVLTDFHELHILDSRYIPKINTVFIGEHKQYIYTQYADKNTFAEIYYLLSRESVADNSILKYAENVLGKSKGKYKKND